MPSTIISPDTEQDFQELLHSELEQTRRSLKEVSLMVEQSQAEYTKLAQRNAAITGHVQQIQSQLETTSRNDIRTAFMAALDAQQRLLVMKGQLDKLQSDKANLQKLLDDLEKTQIFIDAGGSSNLATNRAAMLEMVINAQELVRQRLSRQMHDGPAQTLSNLIVQMEIVTRLFDIDVNKAKDELNNLKISTTTTFQKVRAFIFELRPMMLDDLGLFPTLKKFMDAFKEQNNVEVNLVIKGKERRIEQYLEVLIFRAIQELMSNATRYNLDLGSKVQINILVTLEPNLIRVSVSDNGKGFTDQEVNKSDFMGVKTIQERLEMVGGSMDIESTMGQGTQINFQVPSIEYQPEKPAFITQS